MAKRETDGPNHGTRVEDLIATIAAIKDKRIVERFLRDLCTRTELTAMAQRWEVAQLVDRGVPYTQIAKRTGASTATVTKFARARRRTDLRPAERGRFPSRHSSLGRSLFIEEVGGARDVVLSRRWAVAALLRSRDPRGVPAGSARR
jgi:TrpR-related protein YerC/YecD